MPLFVAPFSITIWGKSTLLSTIKEYNRVRYVTKSFPCNRTELYIKVGKKADSIATVLKFLKR